MGIGSKKKTMKGLSYVNPGIPTLVSRGWGTLPDFITGETDLIRGIRNMPTSVKNLVLSHKQLGEKTVAELVRIFAVIPISIEVLYLGSNGLGKKTGVELAQAFATIPESVIRLDLSWNDLNEKTGAELALAFAAIPKSVATLNLLGNGLNKKTGVELAQAFAAIPESVTTLDLSWNNLNEKTGAELALAFAAIPKSVATLNLSTNYLYRQTGSELVQAFAAIPESVTTINLSDNKLGKKTSTELTEILAAIPVSVKKLDLSPLEFLIEICDRDTAETILNRRDVDVNYNNPLFGAASKGMLNVVMLLLEHPDIKVNVSQEVVGEFIKSRIVTPREVAILYGHTEIANAIDEHERKALDSSKNTAEVVNSLYFQYRATDIQDDGDIVDFETTVQEQPLANSKKHSSSSFYRKG